MDRSAHARRYLIRNAAALGLLACASPRLALGQAYPTGPVKIVAPFPPGGGADTIARVLTKQLGTRFGQPFVIENKPGSGTLIAASIVAQAPRDGYTLMTVTADTLAVASSLYTNPVTIPEDHLAPITQVVQTPLYVTVRPDSPYHSLAELIDAAKKAPESLTYGTPGIGTLHQLGMELLARQAGIKVRHIAYKGSAAAVTDLLGGHIDYMMLESPTALAQLKGSKIRVLAITSPQRLSLSPDVPTVAESGFPDFQAMSWMGFACPRGVPAEIVAQLHHAIRDAVKSPEISGQLREMGLDPIVSESPEAFDRFAAQERARWAAVIKATGIQLQ